jgi:hypothetical protein
MSVGTLALSILRAGAALCFCKTGLVASGSRYGSVEGYCEDGNESSGSIKGKVFFD